MNRKLLVVAIFVSTLFLISSLPVPRVKASLPTITLTPQYPSAVVGNTFQVQCWVNNVAALYAVEIQIGGWNTAVMRYVSRTVTIPVETYPGGILHSPVMFIADKVDESGAPGTMYWLAISSMAPTPEFDGSGTAFVMTFLAVAPGISWINFTAYTMADIDGNMIPGVTSQNARVSVVAAGRANPWNVPADFPTITAALASPSVQPGDTIFVWNGVYMENPVITKANIKIIGQSNAGVSVQSVNGDPCFLIDADGVTLMGLTIRGLGISKSVGVMINFASSCTIWLNVIDDFDCGVFIYTPFVFPGGNNNAIIGNDIRNCNSNHGGPGYWGSCSVGVLMVQHATGNQVRGNYIGTFGADWYGVGTWETSGNTITLNNFDNIGAPAKAFVCPGDGNAWDSSGSGVNVGNWWMGAPAPYSVDTANVDHYGSEWRDWNAYLWDINRDGKVDMRDIGTAAKAFLTQWGMLNWNPAADITGPTPGVPDGKVDMRDIGLAAKHFGWIIPW